MKTPYVLAIASVFLIACSTQPDMVEIPAPTDSELNSYEVTLDPFAFTMPLNWEVLSKGYDEVSFSVPDDQYSITLVMYLKEEGVRALPTEGAEVQTTLDGIQIYSNGCSGTFCGNLAYGGKAYSYSFDINSNEPVSENLDGVWVPDVDVTHNEIDAFIATVHLAK